MQKKIQHEIKLEKSVKVILGILAVGLLVNAFNPQDFGIKEALAELNSGSILNIKHSGRITSNY